MTIKISKKCTPGTLVSKRGGWYCPAKTMQSAVGVWMPGHSQVIMLMDGSIVERWNPPGIILQGSANIKVEE